LGCPRSEGLDPVTSTQQPRGGFCFHKIAEVHMAQQTEKEIFRAIEEPQAHNTGRDVEGARFPELLIMLAKHKAFILKFVGIAMVLSLVAVLLLQKSYTANAKLLPPQQNQSISTSAVLSQLGPLAGLAGKLDLKSPSDLYVAMLRSRTVADDLIARFDLMGVYKQKLHEDARTQLEQATEIKAGKEGVISISVRDKDPKRASDLANAYIEELEILTRSLAVTEAAQRRVFF